MHHRFVLLLLLFCACALAQEQPEITVAERDTALAAIKKWRSFEGTWEGEVRYIAAPKEDWKAQRTPVRITLKNNQPKVFIRRGIRDWTELGTRYWLNQPDELTILIHVYGAGGVWTEHNAVLLTRRSENDGEVFIQRVVTNWAGKALKPDEVVYSDTRSGKVQRQ
jgi:hypothetical protein